MSPLHSNGDASSSDTSTIRPPFSDSDTSTIRPPFSDSDTSTIRPLLPTRTSPKLPPPNPTNPSLMEQRFTRKPKPAPLGQLDTPRIPLAQLLGLTTPTLPDGQPILPSALPTRHVSHGVTNILERGTRTPSASGARIFSRDVMPVSQPLSFDSHPTSQDLQPAAQLVCETPHPPIQTQGENRDLTPAPSGTTHPHIWTSTTQILRDDFRYVKSQAHHLGSDESPAFPESASQFARVRADQKNRAADALKKEVEEREKLNTEQGRVEKERLEEANARANGWARRAIELWKKGPGGK